MYDTTPPTIPIRTKDDNIKRFLLGILPTAAAVIAVLWQTLDPYLAHHHQWLLGTLAAVFVCFTLADWLWCANRDIKYRLIEKEQREAARYRALMRKLDIACEAVRDHDASMSAVTVRTDRCIQGVHRRLDAETELLKEITDEITHLRRLLVETESPLVAQQLGPRRLN